MTGRHIIYQHISSKLIVVEISYTTMAAESAAEIVQLDSFHNIFSLAGKVAVITGGSRGLGLQTASGYVAECL